MWHKQHEVILKGWGESCACYRYLHNKAYQYYRRQSVKYTVPIIVMTTLSAAANFMQDAFPDKYTRYIPAGTGALNLVAAVMTTMSQFLRLNELTESHRVSSIHYGKLARSIRVELTLPVEERNRDGSYMIEISRSEYDRLMDQSPAVPRHILSYFEKKYKNKEYTIPDMLYAKPINPSEGKLAKRGSKKEQNFTNMGLLMRELEDMKERNIITSVKCDLDSCELGIANGSSQNVNPEKEEDQEE